MKFRYMFVLTASAIAVPALQASVFFTFDDAAGSPEFAYFEGFKDNATSPGFFTYKGVPLDLSVDGTEEGLGTQTFVAQLQMDITIGSVVGTIDGALAAPILGGYMRFVDTNAGDETILGIAFSNGGLLTLSSVGKLIASSNTGDIFMGAGPALTGFLGGQQLAPVFDASFLLSNISSFVTTNPDNFLTSFSANAVFDGSAELVPTPSSFALFGLGAMSMGVRRRRHG
jgi:hypothetical protein